jgi:hypothetical protein
MIWPHVTLAALAARAAGRPVTLALTREQMFSSCGHREEQEQRIELGASADGRITTLRHHKLSATSPGQAMEARSCQCRRRARSCSRSAPSRRWSSAWSLASWAVAVLDSRGMWPSTASVRRTWAP